MVTESVAFSVKSLGTVSVFTRVTARGVPKEAERPLSRVADTSSLNSRSTKKPITERSKRSLAIVEDEQDLLSIYSRVTKELGFDPVIVAREGEDIVRAVVEGRASPDVVIIDYRLPGMNGIEAAKRILKHRPATKVIVASADDSVREESISLGFTFLQKPFSLAAFSDRIRRVVSQLSEGP
ncbi:MAG: response regulator [Nitrososphaerota archaeon]|nr:response regulator [Nitrososphaerota archaeon]